MRKSLVVFVTLFIPAISHADLIISANLNKSLSGEVDIKVTGNPKYSFDTDISSFAIFFGNVNSDNNRLLVGLEKLKIKVDDMDYSASALGWRLDGQFVFGEGNVKPYVGGGIGFYLLDNPPMLQGTYLEDDVQLGVSFQLMGGAKIDLSPNLELDLSLQFQGFLWQDIEYIGYYESTKISMSSSQVTLGAGIAYKF